MFRSIITVFVLALAAQATFALIDYPRETVVLKFTNKDLKHAGSYPEPRDISTYLGTLSAGNHIANENVYVRYVEYQNNYNNAVLVVNMELQASGTIHFVTAQNVDGSEAVVCETAKTLGSSRSIIHIRIAPGSTAKLRVQIATH